MSPLNAKLPSPSPASATSPDLSSAYSRTKASSRSRALTRLAPAGSAPEATVLMVDDDPVSRRILEVMLRKAGHRYFLANNSDTARQIITDLGPASFDCVVTDYNMPGENGLDLLLWIREIDPTLSVIMITDRTEREIVASTLRGGASGFLDKPITEVSLAGALTNGIATTRFRRRLADSDQAVRQVGKTQGQMFGLGSQSSSYLKVCYHPCHSAGGDFINFFQLAPGCFHVLTADVSGHDMRAAFVSAFFQGLARGMLESGQSVPQVLQRFNLILGQDGDRIESGPGASSRDSLCACVVSIDLTRREVIVCNHGIPQPWQINESGDVTQSTGSSQPPLGWFDDLAINPARVSLPWDSAMFVWTDGLEDLAEAHGASPLSLAARLLRSQQGEIPPLNLSSAKDDVLVVKIQLSPEVPKTWLPVLADAYAGGSTNKIDQMQLHWQRSLELALPDLPESRLFDVILSLREAVLNALRHGCGGRPDQTCNLVIAVNPAQSLLRIRVRDPGPGHGFNCFAMEKSATLRDLHRGLVLIHQLASRINSERNGADITLDFSYEANPHLTRP